MGNQEQIERIRNGTYTRTDLVKLHANAVRMRDKGAAGVDAVIAAIDTKTPLDRTMVFMGFCPGADFENRLDIEWKAKGICTFIFFSSKQQLERFNNIWPGDLIILKKRNQFGKTMLLHGHGRVTGIKHDGDGNRYLEMNWSAQEEIIEVPLMGCNSTIDIKTNRQLADGVPEEFYGWIGDKDE